MNERLNSNAEEKILVFSEKLLKFLDDNAPRNEYTHINNCINILTITLFRVADQYIENMEEKKKFAYHISDILIQNFKANEK